MSQKWKPMLELRLIRNITVPSRFTKIKMKRWKAGLYIFNIWYFSLFCNRWLMLWRKMISKKFFIDKLIFQESGAINIKDIQFYSLLAFNFNISVFVHMTTHFHFLKSWYCRSILIIYAIIYKKKYININIY